MKHLHLLLFKHLSILLLLCLMMLVVAIPPAATTADTIITLDNLNGNNGVKLNGTAAGQELGRVANTAGDLNGDGLDDIVVTLPNATANGKTLAGVAYVIFGSATNTSPLALDNLPAGKGFRINGLQSFDQLGYSAAGADDLNNDGYGDLILGAPGASHDDVESSGAAFVIFGRPTFPTVVDLGTLNGGNGFRLNGVMPDDRLGSAVAGAGDVNGDGFADLIVGAPNATVAGKEAAGFAYVVYGDTGFTPVLSAAMLNGNNGFRFSGNAAEDNTGAVVASAGDVNRDGFADVLVAAPPAKVGSQTEAGRVYTIFGGGTIGSNINATALNGTNGFRADGVAEADHAGQSAAAAGDVNGDGFGDIVIGAPYASDYTGMGYVVYGKSTFGATIGLGSLNGSNGFKISGATANDQVGLSVSSAGDVNGDGLDDTLIGAPGVGEGLERFSGAAYVVLGNNTFPATVELSTLADNDGFALNGLNTDDQAGQRVNRAGDINGDGYDDFLIGAPRIDINGSFNAGALYLVFGGGTLGTSLPVPVTHQGTGNSETLNGSAAADVMIAHRGNDEINALAGNDVLKGAAGNDLLSGGPGEDLLEGDNGFDIASYTTSAAGITVNLRTGVGSGGDAEGDHLHSVEGVVGSDHNDTLIGNGESNSFDGRGGSNTITGNGGSNRYLFTANSGDTTITDFVPGAGSKDVLDFGGYAAVEDLADLTISPVGGDAKITFPNGNSILLKDIQTNALHEDDYRFGSAPLAVNDNYSTPVNTSLTVVAPGVLANDQNPLAGGMTAAVVNNVAHGTLTLNSNGSFTYVPQNGYVGEDQFTYRANNGTNSNTAAVFLEVTSVGPTAVDDFYSTPLETPLTIPAPGVLGNDLNPGGGTLTSTLVDTPTYGSVTMNANGSFTYTPDKVEFVVEDSFTYRASNGQESNVATVTVAITNPNEPPVANDDAYQTLVDMPLTIEEPGVLENDYDANENELTAVLVNYVQHGTLALNANGSFTYTPDDGYDGADQFTYKARGARDSEAATVTLMVIDTGGAPLAQNDGYVTGVNIPLTVSAPGVLGNDQNPTGGSMTAELVSNAQHGSVTLNPNGSFIYTPAGNFTGVDLFRYRANNGQTSNVATVTITVTETITGFSLSLPIVLDQ